MRRLVFASAVIAAGFCNQVAHAAAPPECFTNSGAVFSAHSDASHASYIVRGKRSGGSGRCWYADAFKAQADAKPALRSAATTARTSARRHTIKAPQPPATAMASASQLSAAAMASASPLRGSVMEPVPQPRTTLVAPVSLEFPKQLPPAIQIAVHPRELSRLLPVDESPTDFNSRFSASGYRAPK